jgi:ABC-type amino acid transport substrate-binding protein
MNMKRALIALASLGCVALGGAAWAQDKPTFVAVPGNVFATLDKGVPHGIFLQTMDAVLRQMGKTPTYVTIPTSIALQSLASGKVDVGTVVVPSAKEPINGWLSDPILKEYSVVAVLRGKGFPLQKVADLHGKRLGARQGYQYPILEQSADVHIQRFRSDGEMIRALLFGDVDAILIAAMSDINSLRTEGMISKLDILPVAVGVVPLVAVFSAKTFSDTELDDFNAKVGEFKSSPAWQEILNQNGFADLARDWPLIKR